MRRFIWCTILSGVFIYGCSDGYHDSSHRNSILRLAVTTSTRDSGLLDVLVPVFEQEQRARVDVIAVGTGKALKLGHSGDVDVVLVHSRPAEDAFLAAGHSIRREDVMYNSFEVLGPASDPAEIREMEAVPALQRIAIGKHRFVSRGDESGTHQRELSLWQAGGGRTEWNEYVESGRGMGATLIMADQKQAYVLTDRGTYVTFKAKISLVPLVVASKDLMNPYGIMIVNPQKHPRINAKLAGAFVDFIISPEAQQIIRNYKIEGEQLFYPLRLPR